MRRFLNPKVHPRARELFRSHLANRSFAALLFEYVCLLALLSVIGAGVEALLRSPADPSALIHQSLAHFAFLAGGEAPASAQGALWGFLRLLLHTVLLGGLVFKLLLTRQVFVFRHKVSIFYDAQQRAWMLAIRLYNASRLQVRDASFAAYLRVPFVRDGEQLIRNPPLTIATPKNKWHFALPFVPYTVKLRLEDTDVLCHPEGPQLVAIQGTQVRPENFDPAGETFLVLCVEGRCPQTGQNISESFWARMTDAHEKSRLSWGRPAGVQTTPGKKPRSTGSKPKSWKGWPEFEKNRRGQCLGYVLGYGSLVDPADTWRLLCGFDLMHEKPVWHELSGFRLTWNVAMDNSADLSDYKYYVEPGSEVRPDVCITYLNLEPDKAATTCGLAVPVCAALLEHLDQRERNYQRTEVGLMARQGGAVPIWAYLAKEESRARFEKAAACGKAVIVQSYREKVESGYAAHGEQRLAQYRQAAKHSLRVLDLELRRTGSA